MDDCRSCGAPLGAPFLSLGNAPLSNAFLRREQLCTMEPTYPLDVYLCEQCFLVQLDEFERAKNIFDADYAYFASFSASWLAHCRAYTAMIVERLGLDTTSQVVEIASNDGYLLQYFQDRGIPVLGVEPAQSVADAAIAKGIRTHVVFFGEAHAETMRSRGQTADLLIGNNVLAHNPNINDFVRGIARVLKPNGVATLEFPHLLRQVQGNQFDTVYHEHFSYLSMHAVQVLFGRHGLEVFDADELATHGGSLRVYAQLSATGKRPTAPSIEKLRGSERAFGLLERKTYEQFAERAADTKRELLSLLIDLKRSGKRIVGYGAPAKGNTLLNYCGVRGDFIDYTVDRNPHKQNRYLPGSHIPIYPPERLLADKPDYVFILPWNIKNEIIEQLAEVRAWGGAFIVPIPKPVVIS